MVKATDGEERGESCVTVGPVISTAGILAYSWLKALAVNGAGHSADIRYTVADLGSTLAGSKHCKGDELPSNGPWLSVRKSSSI